jgi:hypothetical protein
MVVRWFGTKAMLARWWVGARRWVLVKSEEDRKTVIARLVDGKEVFSLLSTRRDRV